MSVLILGGNGAPASMDAASTVNSSVVASVAAQVPKTSAAAPLLVRAGRVQLSARAATGCCVSAHDVRLARLPARVPPARRNPSMRRHESIG